MTWTVLRSWFGWVGSLIVWWDWKSPGGVGWTGACRWRTCPMCRWLMLGIVGWGGCKYPTSGLLTR